MATQKGRAAIGITAACAIVATALFLIPAWIVQPFRAQAQDKLAMALAIHRIAPATTLVLAGVGITCLLYFRPRRWSAAISAIAMVITVLAAAAVRVNYFELMFHPNPTPRFIAAADADIDSDDMVMVARIGKVARAYPVRIMAYHHLVNDTLAGVAIVPTY